MSGKILRLKRVIASPERRIVIFPLDHGVTCGPVSGLERMDRLIGMGVREGVDAFVMHKGMLRFLAPMAERLPGIFMHLSASTLLGPSCHHKVMIGTVEEAIRRGADGVSMHVNLGDEHEPQMIEYLGAMGDACSAWQIPLLVMIYVRGSNAPSPVPDPAIAHAARVAAELGADLVKIPAPEDPQMIAEITDSLPIPVVVAGGSKASDTFIFLEKMQQGLNAGAHGVAIGRNVFQHERPEVLLRAICDIVHRGVSVEEAWERFCRERPHECPQG